MSEVSNIFTFGSTHNSIAADALLEAKEIEHKLMPIPNEISAGCGFCVSIPSDYANKTMELFRENDIAVEGRYRAERTGLRLKITVDEQE